MTKRFENKGRIIIDNETKLHYIMSLEWEVSLVTKLLNQLHEQNEQLRHSLNCLQDRLDDFPSINEENKQLKQIIKSVLELLTIEVDVFSDEATEHDLIAYKELQQLDNKDAYYVCTATKKAIELLKKELQDD